MDYDVPAHTPEQIAAMNPTEFKSYETRIRRAAARQGFRLERSRRRDPRALDYGTYTLHSMLDGASGVASGPFPSLADVAEWLQANDRQ
jgi:hypothetical protein